MTARVIAKTAVAVSALLFSTVLANSQTPPAPSTGSPGTSPNTSQGSAPSRAPAATSNQQTAPGTGVSSNSGSAPGSTSGAPSPSPSASGQPGHATQPGTGTQNSSTQPTTSPSGATSGSSQHAAPGTSSTTSAATAPTVNLTQQQRTEIRQTVINGGNAPRVSSVNFNIGVGVVVPQTVQFAPLPPTIVSIHPDWRGYDYFVYAEEIIIVEPGTRRIVAVLRV